MLQEYYIIFVDKIHVAVSLHESQKFFVGFGSMHALPALSKFSSDLGSMWLSTPTNQISATRNLFQSPAQRHNRQKHAKKGGHLSITATNYLQNFGLTPFHITMSYD